MPTTCCVFGCKSRRKPGDNSIFFHKFPNDEEINMNWLVAIKRTALSIEDTKSKVVCSRHFMKDAYLERPGTYKPRLKPDAIPTIFDSPQIKARRGRPRKKEPIEDSPPEFKAEGVRRGRRRKREPLALALKRWGQKRNLEDPMYIPPKAIKQEKESPPREINGFEDITTPPPRRSGRPRKILIKREPGESPPRETANAKRITKAKTSSTDPLKLTKKFANMKVFLESLRKNHMINGETYSTWLDHFADLPLDSLQIGNGLHNSTEERARKFCLSLYYQAPTAYCRMRKRLKLPHPSTVRNWSFSDDYAPGLLSEVFESLDNALQERSWMSDCALLIDSMAVNPNSYWDEESDTFVGHVGYGDCIIESGEALASKVIVIFLVGLVGTWRCPISYFLVHRLSPIVLSQVIKTCLCKLADIGVRVWSITFDKPWRNRSLLRLLGCDLITSEGTKHKILSSFKHPTRDYYVHIVFDYSNTLELVRNALCDMRTFRHGDERVEWKYFIMLHEMLHKGSDIDSKDVYLDPAIWSTHKMNVKLARRMFSSEVSDAISWLRCTKHPNFEGSKATSDFARLMESVFSVLDAKISKKEDSNEGKDVKSKAWWNVILHGFIGYMVKLKSEDGKTLLQHERRQFIVGSIVMANSLSALINNFSAFQTYCLSLDNLRLFFAYIEGNRRSDFNALQLRKRFRSFFTLSNCLAFEDFDTISKSTYLHRTVRVTDDYLFVSKFEENVMHQMAFQLNDLQLGHRSSILQYIAGYVAKRLIGKVGCPSCSILLITRKTSVRSLDDFGYSLYKPYLSLDEEIDLRGVFLASDSVIEVVRLSEHHFRLMATQPEHKFTSNGIMIAKTKASVMCALMDVGFLPFCSHETRSRLDLFEPPHHLQLIKKVVEEYVSLRLKVHKL